MIGSGHQGGGRSIEYRLQIRRGLDRVWEWLTDPKEMPRWFYPELCQLTALEVGGRYRLIDPPGEDDSLEIVEIEAPHRLVCRWHSSEPSATLVDFELSSSGSLTELRFVNSGYGEGDRWDRFYLANARGWMGILVKLVALAEGLSLSELPGSGACASAKESCR